MALSLMRLPPEIFWRILGEVLTFDRTIKPVGPARVAPDCYVPGRDLKNLVLVCSEMRFVAYQLYFGTNTFCLENSRSSHAWLCSLGPDRVKILKRVEIVLEPDRYSGWHRIMQKLVREAETLQILQLWPLPRYQPTTRLTFETVFAAGRSQFTIYQLATQLRHFPSLETVKFVGQHDKMLLKQICRETGCHIQALRVAADDDGSHEVWYHVEPTTSVISDQHPD